MTPESHGASGFPFWAWMLLIIAGTLTAGLVGLVVLGLFAQRYQVAATQSPPPVTGPEIELLAAFRKTNPDFEYVKQVSSGVRMRHRKTGRELIVFYSQMEPTGHIDYRGLAKKNRTSPDWLKYPASDNDGRQTYTTHSVDQVLTHYKKQLSARQFLLISADHTFLEACNMDTIECAVISVSHSNRENRTFFTAAYRTAEWLEPNER